MNYCSIQEAWGQNDYITNQYKKYNCRYNDSNNPIKILENTLEKTLEKTSEKTLENFSSDENHTVHVKKINNCNDFFLHLDSCKHCQTMIKNNYSPKILEKFSEILDTNKDIVVLILVGVCIMLFFNLVNSVTKNEKN